MNKQFWNNRAKIYGHTGWEDPVIYAYDQYVRIKAIEKIINSLDCERKLALDFGTGTGDFAQILSKEFKSVLAFDISRSVLNIAQDKYGHIPNIKFLHGNSIKDVVIDDDSLNLILSITVLDHILEDKELSKTILHFEKKLSKNSYIVALEYPPLDKRDGNAYQRFLQFSEWCSLFSNCGFYLEKYYGFYHPKKFPCKSYKLYSNNWAVKFFKKLKNFSYLKKRILKKLAYSFIRGKYDFFWEGREEDILKIMIFRKHADRLY